MENVGTNIGTAYTGHQGVGLATVLTGEDASNVGMDILKRQAADDDAKRKKQLADRDAMLKLLQTEPEGYWLRHSVDIADMQNSILNDYAGLMASGINDPKSSADPRAIELQKKYMKFMRMVNASKQMKTEADQMQAIIQKEQDGADAFTTDSILAFKEFLETPLDDVVSGRVQAPILERRRPYIDAVTFWEPYLKTYEASLNGQPPTDAGIMDYVDTVLTQPATADKLANTYASRLNQMPSAEKKALLSRAIHNRRSAIQQIAFEDAKRVVKRAEPFNPYQTMIDVAAKVQVDYNQSSGPGGGSKRPDMADLDKNLGVAADALIDSRPEWLTLYDDQGNLDAMKPGETEVQYRARVKKAIVASLKSLVKVNTESFVTDQGKQKKSGDDWLADMKSDNLYTQQRASGYLIGAELFGNLDISGVEIVSSPQDSGGGTLKVTLTTPIGVQVKTDDIVSQAKSQISPAAEVVEKQGKRELLIPLDKTAPTNEMLLRIHDIAFKRTSREYKRQETPTGTLDQFTGGKPATGTNEANKKVKPY